MAKSNYAAIFLLAVMFVLLFTSAWNDSATMDELAHIPSGYSYLTEQDFRLNPEHPPLIKDLSAIPLLTLDLNFPTDVKPWAEDINGQWDMGRIFIYESGNDADKILRYSRFPIMLLALLFGWLFFKWVRSLYGDKVALLALFFYAFSPTFLAHSRYVTTDLAAAFGFFIGIAAFINFLYKGTWKSLLIAGVAFGVAQLLKFSLVILAPLYLVLGVLWVFLNNIESFSIKKLAKEKMVMIGKIALIGVIGILLIWPVYQFHVWNYPIERQLSDTSHNLSSFGMRPLVDLDMWLSKTPALRALGQYMLGVLMVVQRAAGGNTTYFMGEITNVGWPSYFPLLYLFKEHLALHILTLIALGFGIKNVLKAKEKSFKSIVIWMKENFALMASFIFMAVYWFQAVTSPLNIGVRHVLPTFPFIYLLVSREIIKWNFNGWFKSAYGRFVTVLLIWMAASAIITFPYYVSFYNELAGGTKDGHKIATDSNYDWGQDLKRLKDWTDKNLPENEKIAIDYFGGGNLKYYFGNQQESWWSSKGNPADQGIKWFAISLTFLEGARAEPVLNFGKNPADSYSWLRGKEPVARAGTSILIYKL